MGEDNIPIRLGDPILDLCDPYISTDRADLLRVVDLADRIRKELDSIPAANSKVTAAQWSSLTHELYTFLTLSRRIKTRL